MFNNSRVLIILIIVSLGLASYLLFSLNKIDIQNENNINLKIVDSKPDIKKIEENYGPNLENLMKEIRMSINQSQGSQTKSDLNLEEIKNKILNLKSPGNEYKNIHLDLILALSNLEEYFKFGDENKKEKSLVLLDKANQEYLKIIKEKENGI